jgi:hypothetical protein
MGALISRLKLRSYEQNCHRSIAFRSANLRSRIVEWDCAYLARDVRTVQHWEKQEGLPFHRHIHNKLSTVYVFKGELDRWWNERGIKLEDEQTPVKGATAGAMMGRSFSTLTVKLR